MTRVCSIRVTGTSPIIRLWRGLLRRQRVIQHSDANGCRQWPIDRRASELMVTAVVATTRSVAGMMRVASSVDIVQGPRTAGVRLTFGDVAVAVTNSPFENVPSPWMSCFAVLSAAESPAAHAATASPAGQPGDLQVVMIVTCLQVPDAPGKRIVNLVYATEQFRRERSLDDRSLTAAVAVGRWLFATGGLTHHSEERSAAGDRWARAVGGPLPAMRAPERDYDSDASGSAIVAMLNLMAWPSPMPG